MPDLLEQLARSVPAGSWAIGVSGGADSVALLHLMNANPAVTLHVVHLNHETRGDASDGDSDFVADLAATLRLPSTLARRSDFEKDAAALPSNRSARYRKLRQALFASVVREHRLRGVLLAHHADDQAETVLQRLLRGSGWNGLGGMATESKIGGICYFRPMLTGSSQSLRQYLTERGSCWREDESNRSPVYQRNRVRQLLQRRPELSASLIEVGSAVRSLQEWVDGAAPTLPQSFDAHLLSELPLILARRAIAGWLRENGVTSNALTPSVIDQVLNLAVDAAAPPRASLPGGLQIRRKRQVISASTISLPPQQQQLE